MRLTLRTLIAWLDDTLTPAEVKTIGQQVAESPFAKELIERLQRVTRQRRLTYPGDLGSEPTDPNLVASYLDNELQPEQVADFEKRCLTSDVHLAEVASVHQVLSLIGQKAKVPSDARSRMYRLVRGRETAKPQAPTKSVKPKPAPEPKVPVVEPISAWTSGLPAKKSLLERFGPAAAVLAAIALLLWTASSSLQSGGKPGDLALNNPNPPAEPKPIPVTIPEPTKSVVEVAPAPVEPVPKPEDTSRTKPAIRGEVGVFDAIEGVVLKAGSEGLTLDRIEAKTPLKSGTRLINLAPFRNKVKMDEDLVDLVDSTEIVLGDRDTDQASRLELHRGRIVIRPASSSSPFTVRFEGKILGLSAGQGTIVGIERNPSLAFRSDRARPGAVANLRPRRQGSLQVRRGGSDPRRSQRNLSRRLGKVR